MESTHFVDNSEELLINPPCFMHFRVFLAKKRPKTPLPIETLKIQF